MNSNITEIVYNLLYAHDPVTARVFRQIYEATFKGQNDLATMNRFWRLQFSIVPTHLSHRARLALEDNIEEHVWVSNFSYYVIPVIIALELPINIEYGMGAEEHMPAVEKAVERIVVAEERCRR